MKLALDLDQLCLCIQQGISLCKGTTLLRCSWNYFLGLCYIILRTHATVTREASALCPKGHPDAFRFANLFISDLSSRNRQNFEPI